MDPGSQPAAAGPPLRPCRVDPSLAFLTSSQLALMSSWAEEPSRQNLPALSPEPEGQKAGPRLIGLSQLQWLDCVIRRSRSTGHPARPSSRRTLSPALKTRLPRLREEMRGPRPLWRRQRRPDSCPSHLLRSFQNPSPPLPDSGRTFRSTEGGSVPLHPPGLRSLKQTTKQIHGSLLTAMYASLERILCLFLNELSPSSVDNT